MPFFCVIFASFLVCLLFSFSSWLHCVSIIVVLWSLPIFCQNEGEKTSKWHETKENRSYTWALRTEKKEENKQRRRKTCGKKRTSAKISSVFIFFTPHSTKAMYCCCWWWLSWFYLAFFVSSHNSFVQIFYAIFVFHGIHTQRWIHSE